MKVINPLVSVVIPCYNHEQFVQETIQSVIDQTYESIELIIIDDGSQDNSVKKILEMIESCKERFVRFEFRTRANIGLSATLNEALEWCKGEYFSSIASDDILMPNKTELQAEYLGKNELCVGVFACVNLIDEKNEIITDWLVKDRKYRFANILMHEHELLAPTAMLRLETVKNVGGYNSNYYIEDWYMWLKISKYGTLDSINKVVAMYRKHPNNASNDVEKMHASRLAILNDFKDDRSYDKALKNILWMYKYEKYSVKENRSLTSFLKMGKSFPRKTIKLILQKIIYSFR